MLWCGSEMGRPRVVTSSLLAAKAAVQSDPADSQLSSGPRFATGARKGQARSSAPEVAQPGRLGLGEAAP